MANASLLKNTSHGCTFSIRFSGILLVSHAILNTELFTIFDTIAVEPEFALDCQFPAALEQFELLSQRIEQWAEQRHWDGLLLNQLQLVVEELVVNIMNYGYPGREPGQIDFQIREVGPAVYVRIEDDGNAFDPFAMADPDLTLAIEDRPIGGLGIFIIRSYMTEYAYRFYDGRNQVVLKKSRAGSADECVINPV